MNPSAPYHRILVATDFSPCAEAALQQAIWIAKEAGARVVLVHTLPNVVDAMCAATATVRRTKAQDDEEDFQREMRRSSDNRLQRLIDEHHVPGVEIYHETLLGSPFVEIIHAVQREGYDLVLAGTRGLAPWKQFLVGSMAKRLIRKCPSSVWIVRAEDVEPPKSVLIPVDFSDTSQRAALEGLWIARKASASVHLLHVMESIDEPGGIMAGTPYESSWRQEEKVEAQQLLDEFVRKLDPDPTGIHTHVSWGSAWWEICQYARRLEADLIAMGTIGRCGVKGLLLGNTAELVVSMCDRSVLAVKPADFVSPILPAFWPLHPADT